MATIGVEYIEHFGHVRATGNITSGGQDLATPYYIAEWFAPTLGNAGHEIRFLRRDQAVAERHMRDLSRGGADVSHADRVDLYLVITHGKYEDHRVSLLYDINLDDWFGRSSDWRFGDNCNMEWLMVYGCHSIDGDNLLDHHPIFKGMHLFCGAYADMYDSWTLCEAGADIADNLTCGKPVSEAWCDGATDWFIENHPMAVSVERQETWRNGNPDWPNTVIRSDHLWGHGTTRNDILPTQQFWMTAVWSDAGTYDGWFE